MGQCTEQWPGTLISTVNFSSPLSTKGQLKLHYQNESFAMNYWLPAILGCRLLSALEPLGGGGATTGQPSASDGPVYLKNLVYCVSQAVLLDSTDVNLWYKIGHVALRLTRLPLARHAFEEGLACNPDHWPCLDNLITVLYTLSDYTSRSFLLFLI